MQPLSSTVQPLGEDPDVPTDRKTCCGTSNLRALWGMFLLNTAFAISQMIGSIIANSLSMFSDSGSMLVDSFAYMINIFLERRKNQLGPDATKLWEVYTSVASVVLLVIVTIVALTDAAKRLQSREDDDDVDGRFVLGFAAGNLFVDVIMCTNYCYQLRHRRKPTFKEQVMSETKEQLNMVAAFIHLFADTLRSVTGVIAGILEQDETLDAIFVDAVATFIVCGAIMMAAAFVLYEAYMQYKEYRTLRKERLGREVGIDEEGFGFQPAASSTNAPAVEMTRS